MSNSLGARGQSSEERGKVSSQHSHLMKAAKIKLLVLPPIYCLKPLTPSFFDIVSQSLPFYSGRSVSADI